MFIFRYFIAVSYDQTSIEIYKFKGSEVGGNLIKGINGEVIPGPDDTETASADVRTKVFDQFLEKRHVVRVTTGEEILNRECSLFTDDSCFVIVGSSHFLSDEASSRFYDVYRNNECITPNYRLQPEDYTLSIVSLKTGNLSLKQVFHI